MDALISVIIPVYNTEQYLERCLDSVLNNTYRNLEVICIDDGSTDRSLEVLRRYEASDPRVIVISKENGGVSSARNAGLDRMTGEFVTFIDSDDFVHPQYIEIMYYIIAKSEDDLVITAPTRVSDLNLPIEMNTISIENIEFQSITRSQVYRDKELRPYCHCKLIKSSLIGSCRFLLGYRYGEDILFYASIWENNPDLRCSVFSESVYYYYQGNPISAVATTDEHEMLKATRYCVERCSLSRENEQIYLFMAISQCIWYRYYASAIKGDRTISKETNPLLRRCWRRMIVSKDFSFREKIYLTIKSFFYPIYRLYRLRDPSFRNWEKSEQERQAAIRSA